jgi:hypothetical protein
MSFWEGFEALLTSPDFYLAAAVFWVAVTSAMQRLRAPCAPLPVMPPAVEPARFWTVWLALLATALVGLPILVALSITMWFSPWYKFNWP